MGVSLSLHARAKPIWKRILAHPFVDELCVGELQLPKFRYYVVQDYNFMAAFVRALSLATAKAPNLELASVTLELARATVTVEMKNYERLLSSLGLSLEKARRARPSPTNMAYSNFLTLTAATGTFWECIASIMPCLWSYHEIAAVHSNDIRINKNAVYRQWCGTYLADDYKRLVTTMKDVLDQSESGAEALWPVFRDASIYEYMFWDAAYREESWPL